MTWRSEKRSEAFVRSTFRGWAVTLKLDSIDLDADPPSRKEMKKATRNAPAHSSVEAPHDSLASENQTRLVSCVSSPRLFAKRFDSAFGARASAESPARLRASLLLARCSPSRVPPRASRFFAPASSSRRAGAPPRSALAAASRGSSTSADTTRVAKRARLRRDHGVRGLGAGGDQRARRADRVRRRRRRGGGHGRDAARAVPRPRLLAGVRLHPRAREGSFAPGALAKTYTSEPSTASGRVRPVLARQRASCTAGWRWWTLAAAFYLEATTGSRSGSGRKFSRRIARPRPRRCRDDVIRTLVL